jgi:hypothetical protein
MGERRPDQRQQGISRAGVGPAPSTGVVRATLIIVGGGGVTGVFTYDGTPGASDLATSQTQSTADPFGTATQTGITAYEPGTPDVNVNMTAGTLIFNQGLLSPALIASNSGAVLILQSGTTATDTEGISVVAVPGAANGQVQITGPVYLVASGTLENWHYVGTAGQPAFATGWANNTSGANLAFRELASPAFEVEIIGIVKASASAGSILFVLPAAYVPANNQSVWGIDTTTNTQGRWGVDAVSGNVVAAGFTVTSGDIYVIAGRFSLDI